MKKLINDPVEFVDEMLEGILAAHPEQVRRAEGEPRTLVRVGAPRNGKVALATGGGSGHLPLFLGYVGEGMLDGCSVGGVFQSPSAMQMLAVTQSIHGGAGVVYIYGNYSGDSMNFSMAAEMADAEGIRVAQVVAGEDVASAPKERQEKRRGVAGIFYVYKIAGAMADEMAPLEEVERVARKTCANVRSMGMALSPCTIPEAGRPTFTLGEGEMEIGMGIHGEPGVRRGPLRPADDVVEELLRPVLADLDYTDSEVSVLVNGLGATPREELYILYRKAQQVLTANRVRVFHAYVGEFATSMEMAGASISVLKLDDELKRLLSKPATTPFFVQGQLCK